MHQILIPVLSVIILLFILAGLALLGVWVDARDRNIRLHNNFEGIKDCPRCGSDKWEKSTEIGKWKNYICKGCSMHQWFFGDFWEGTKHNEFIKDPEQQAIYVERFFK